MRKNQAVLRISLAAAALLVLVVLFMPWLMSEAKLRLATYSGATFAVYLNSGHIFYGNIQAVSGSRMVLTNVRSFQKFAVGQETTNTLSTQRSNPITEPENYLVIERSNILFFEQVGDDAPILTQGGAGQ